MAKRGFQGAVLKTLGARDHVATVTEVIPITSHFVRVRFQSETLFNDVQRFPTSWVRIWFPDPEGGPEEHQRGYTLSEAAPEEGTFAIDAVLHQPEGPASAWFRQAAPGQSLAMVSLGARRFVIPEELPAGYLLIGDAASITAINGILEAVPAELPIELYLEQHDAADRDIPLGTHPRLRVHWVEREGPTSMVDALETRDWSNWFAWAAPELATLKHVRVRLREDFGFPRVETYLQAYWTEQGAMGARRGGAKAEDEARPKPEVVTEVPAAAAAIDAAATIDVPPPENAKGAWRAQAGGKLLAPLKRTLQLAGALQGLVTLIQLAPFVLLTELARRMLIGAPAEALWSLGLWAVGLLGTGALLGAALMIWLHLVDARFARGLRERLLEKFSRLPLGWFTARGSGTIKQLVQDDTIALHALVTHAIPDAVAAVVAPIAVLVYLFFVDWAVALLLFVPVLVYVVTMYLMVVQSGTRITESQEWAQRMNAEAASYLEGQPVIRIFGGGAASGFRARLDAHLAFLDAWQRPFIGKKTFMDLVTRPSTFLLLIVVFGAWRITTSRMEAQTLLPFLLLGTTFGARLLGIGYGLSGMRDGLNAAKRLQVALETPELVQRNSADAGAAQSGMDAGAASPAGAGKVEFEQVTFAYRPGVPVLSDVQLTLEPGTITALVGPSGSGKSTLAALLARFHDVEAGAIRIDGVDLRELTPEALYAQLGFVFQNPRLIQGTVHENVALAMPGASREQVEAAARAAQLHERILKLPQGYDTMLGPEPALSGGERQRLTIARAMLADPKILVLDEATAFADPESEHLVQAALSRLMANRTVLVIAHRLHTITGADQIVVLDAGRIVEVGRHEALLSRKGRYARLWEAGGRAGATAGQEGAPIPPDVLALNGPKEAAR